MRIRTESSVDVKQNSWGERCLSYSPPHFPSHACQVHHGSIVLQLIDDVNDAALGENLELSKAQGGGVQNIDLRGGQSPIVARTHVGKPPPSNWELERE